MEKCEMTKTMTSKWVAAALFTLIALGAGAEDETFAALLDRLLPGMGAEEIPAQSQPRQQLQEAVWGLGVPGKEAELREACKLMAARIGKDTRKAARIWLMTQLMREGAAESVAPLAACLKDGDAQIRECARRALMNNADAAANAVLLDALKSAKTAQDKEAFCLALCYRADPASVPALAGQLKTGGAVAVAAARGLGAIADAEAAGVLAGALSGASGELRRRIGDAYLLCADRLVASGKTTEAAAIYAKLNAKPEPQPVRLAALQGQIMTAGDKAVSVIVDCLKGEDNFARNVAAGAIQDLPPGADIKGLAAKLSELPEVGQELVLHAFAMRDAPALLLAVMKAVKSESEPVRKAALQCLATLGDVSAVPVLVDAMLAGGGCADAARRSLALLHGKGVDERLVGMVKRESDAKRKTAFMGVLQHRGTPAAAGALVEILDVDDAQLRGAAMRALGDVACAEQIPAMIQAMLKTEGRERRDSEKAIVAVCKRCSDGKNAAAPLLTALDKADSASRAQLLPMIGDIGGAPALKLIETSLNGGDEAMRAAAVEAVCRWPDNDALPLLEQLAGGAGRNEDVAKAVRAYVRLATSVRRNHKQTLEMLRKAMGWAKGIKERKLIVGRVVQVRRLEALRFVVPYLDDPELANDAGRAVVYLAGRREIRGPHKDEVRAALDKTLATAKDKWVQKEAARWRKGID